MTRQSQTRRPKPEPGRDWRRGLDQAVAAVANDHRSGAAEVALSALDLWAQLLDEIPSELLQEATTAWARGLVEAQPSMAPLYHMGARIMDAGGKVAWERAGLADRCRRLRVEVEETPGRVALVASRLLIGARVIVTYSRSSTVLRALEAVAHLGHRPKVILSEGRPMLEGLDAAREVLGMGLPVHLTVDAALPAQVAQGDLVILGGDSLGPKWLVNKVGTSALAAMARHKGVPIYTLCGSDKWLPETWESRVRMRENDPEEVLPNPPEGLQISNPYFERTPLEWLTGVVSEKAILSPQEVRCCLEDLDSGWLMRDT